MPKCSDCHETRSKSEFAKSQFKKPPNKWRCRSCARAAAVEAGACCDTMVSDGTCCTTECDGKCCGPCGDCVVCKMMEDLKLKKPRTTLNGEKKYSVCNYMNQKINAKLDLKPDDTVRFTVPRVEWDGGANSCNINGEIGRVKKLLPDRNMVEVEVISGCVYIPGSALTDTCHVNSFSFPVSVDVLEKFHIPNDEQFEADRREAFPSLPELKTRASRSEAEDVEDSGDAYFDLGLAYQDVVCTIVVQDTRLGHNYAKLARSAYQKGAAMGNIRSMAKLGFLYLNGIGGPQDHERAGLYYKKAADQGDHVQSAYKYALLLIHNVLACGVDTVQAELYLQFCKDKGYWEAMGLLKRVRVHNGKCRKFGTPQLAQATPEGRYMYNTLSKESKERIANGGRTNELELDPEGVFKAMPQELVDAISNADENPEQLERVCDEMDPQEMDYHLRRFVASHEYREHLRSKTPDPNGSDTADIIESVPKHDEQTPSSHSSKSKIQIPSTNKKKKSNKTKNKKKQRSSTSRPSSSCTRCDDCGCCTEISCYHGSDEEKCDVDYAFQKLLDRYEEIIPIILQPSCSAPDRTRLENNYIAENHAQIIDHDFANYLFSYCTQLYLMRDGKMDLDSGNIDDRNMRIELTQVLLLGLRVRYDLLNQKAGNGNYGPGSTSYEKMLKYRRDVQTERGIIRCLAREIPCECMNDALKKATAMEKVALCFGCSHEFLKRDMFYCVCRFATYCGK